MRCRQLVVAALLCAGCESAVEPPVELPPPVVAPDVRIEAVTPMEFTGIVGTEATPVPTVLATDQHRNPVKGAAIQFELTGEGAIANASVNTDSLGRATVGWWKLGTAAVSQRLKVSVNGRASLVFDVRATAGPAARIVRTQGTVQVGAAGEKLSEPLRVRVADAFDNPVPGVSVTFTVLAGEGRIEGSPVLTDALGIAESGLWTLGSLPGMQQVRAQSAGVEVVFSALACNSCTSLLFWRDGFIYRTYGLQETRLTEGYHPAWSPDGQRIAFARHANGRSDIYLMDADGSNVIRRTHPGASDDHYGFHSPAWSPDGRRLAVASTDGYGGNLYTLNVAGDGAPVHTRGMAAEPAWSPDGSKIAFVRLSGYDYGDHALDVMNADGSDVRTVIPLDAGDAPYIDNPSWSPDGRRIAFSKCLAVFGCDVYSIGSDGSGLKQLTHQRSTFSPTWSPDGASIVFSIWTESTPWIAIVSANGGESFTINESGATPAWRPGPRL